MARFATLYSGSSGNSAVVLHNTPAGQEYLLVDMGKNCKQTLLALQALELQDATLRGILITHEHIDHVSGLKVFLKKCPVPVYGSAATLAALQAQQILPDTVARYPLANGQSAMRGGFTVQAFATSHDSADCCGFRITTADGTSMAIATDLGVLNHPVYENLLGCGLVALESNYDRVMLQMGPYPYYLKTRIASQRGHLSNDDAAAAIADLLADGCHRFALCHLSRENNTPDLARATVTARLAEDGRFAPQQLTPQALTLQVSPRDNVSDWIDF